MSNSTERFHAWSHLVLFLMLFMITLAMLRFGAPTGLATGNHTITAGDIGDLKPFLTAVGLLMGLFVAALAVFGMNRLEKTPRQEAVKQTEESNAQKAKPEAQPERSLADINRDLARIRKMLK
ncbi:MAG: hypothetical protein QXT19_05215 [Candidatus Woesearchaeota archaeon]